MCPSQLNFQFDTSFMFIGNINVLTPIKKDTYPKSLAILILINLLFIRAIMVMNYGFGYNRYIILYHVIWFSYYTSEKNILRYGFTDCIVEK